MGSPDDVDPYLIPGTNVLQNLLGLTSSTELSAAEADLSFARALQLLETPAPATNELAEEQFLGDLTRENFVRRLAHHYEKINTSMRSVKVMAVPSAFSGTAWPSGQAGNWTGAPFTARRITPQPEPDPTSKISAR